MAVFVGINSGVLYSDANDEIDSKPPAAQNVGENDVAPAASSSMFFGSKDAGLVSWGGPRPFPTPIHAQPNLTLGASFVLWDNLWNTNYP